MRSLGGRSPCYRTVYTYSATHSLEALVQCPLPVAAHTVPQQHGPAPSLACCAANPAPLAPSPTQNKSSPEPYTTGSLMRSWACLRKCSAAPAEDEE